MGCGASTPATPLPPSQPPPPPQPPSSSKPLPRAMIAAPRTPLAGPPPRATLHVILPLSNPVGFRRRQQLFDECLARMLAHAEALAAAAAPVRLHVVTAVLKYDGAAPTTAVAVDAYHTALAVHAPPTQVLWAKENLVNLAINHVLPVATHIGWVDADISFDSATWVADTVDALDALGDGGFVQMFERAHLLDYHEGVMHTTTSFGAQHVRGRPYASVANTSPAYWHPGFAWAAAAPLLAALSAAFHGAPLLERTLGGADRHMAMALIGRGAETVPAGITYGYAATITEWQRAATAHGAALGVVRGDVRHYWHGELAKRRYMERWDILRTHAFMPHEHMVRRADGVLLWAPCTAPQLKADVLAYFQQRDEDDRGSSRPLPPLPPASTTTQTHAQAPTHAQPQITTAPALDVAATPVRISGMRGSVLASFSVSSTSSSSSSDIYLALQGYATPPTTRDTPPPTARDAVTTARDAVTTARDAATTARDTKDATDTTDPTWQTPPRRARPLLVIDTSDLVMADALPVFVPSPPVPAITPPALPLPPELTLPPPALATRPATRSDAAIVAALVGYALQGYATAPL